MKNGVENEYGEIAQLARAHGSYPWCRGFESPLVTCGTLEKSRVLFGFMDSMMIWLSCQNRVLKSTEICEKNEIT